MGNSKVLQEPFNLATHKETFVNYLEVIVLSTGDIVYAVPSHQEKLIEIAGNKLGLSRQGVYDACPEEYYFDVIFWLCKVTGCVALWDTHMDGVANREQEEVINQLIREGLYKGKIVSN